ncbi:unnamed protein product [Spirodela intermedia]|uniref:Receptor-like serine/threonine-protein kinase n=1 Tax=Spirodela intermedia TaxID=51605 RepID=A0A7I8IWK4_SPIIN|nr:unnamed protein product [Spirodela intermedia]CAA6662367.1 unnamed protein product [Spirodela intermedia]
MEELHRRRCSPACPLPATAILFHLLCSFVRTAQAQVLDNPTAAVPTRWPITTPMRNFTFNDGSQVRPILLRRNRQGFGITYACGFYCRGDCASFLFAIYIVHSNSGGGIVLPASGFPQVVWAANRARPVTQNATLELASDGDLVLTDANGTKVWSSGTSGKSVAGMNITESGNLVLFGGVNNQTIWDSFSSPTDSLVPGQKLQVGQALTANDSAANFTEGLYFLFANSTGLIAFVGSNPPERYASYTPPTSAQGTTIGFFEFRNGSLFTNTSDQYLPPSQYLRLESDGSLVVYEWRSEGWVAGRDLLNDRGTSCFYPTVCGRYAICSGNNQCSCPQWDAGGNDFFLPIDDRNLGSGCREVTPLSCEAPQNHSVLRLNDVSYFTYDQKPADISDIDPVECSAACSRNCSCRAAFFRYGTNASAGNCFLTSEVLSLKNHQPEVAHYNSTAFIKVQIPVTNVSLTMGNGTTANKGVIIGATLGAASALLVVVGCGIFIARNRAAASRDPEEEADDDLEHVSGMPRRFSLEELQAATEGFSKKLGQGGFGSVFEGKMDGQMVAVKRLDGVAEGRKQFMAEVQTIGKIHHFNLVKLVGYCAEKSSKLLVYEFMPNSSLDRWIFPKDRKESALDWQKRRKIVLGIARALTYLHEECAQKIAHLDIKPQNILLDERFEAKVSDFGLAKLIDRDKTQVETRMRGTVGYLAPEWLSSMITEMADVYSFGVVVLEVVTGRKNLDRDEEEGAGGELRDLIDRSLEGLEDTIEEATRMLQLGLWCLQHDHKRRPSMSTVVKVLEGAVAVETELEDGSWSSPAIYLSSNEASGSAPLLASVLSGPR